MQPMDWPLAKALGLERPTGALLAEVERGSPAEKAGIREGDVIVAIDGKKIEHWQEVHRVIAHRAPGTKVKVDVVRDRKTLTFEATLGRMEDDRPPTTGASPPWQGIGLQVEDAPGGGALVRRVAQGSLSSGVLEEGDVVVELNGAPVRSAADFERIERAANRPKATLLFKIRRRGHVRFGAVEIP
jgi:serine protease Do